MTGSICAALGAAVLTACAHSQPPRVVSEPVEKPLYRPDWTAAIPMQMDEIRACTEGRPTPVAVIHVQALAAGATGITAVDGLGHVEDCAVSEGEVVLREPNALDPGDLEGLPLFSPGPDHPAVAPGVLCEGIEENEAIVGWLYWPVPPSSGS